ncbi:MAG: PAS domain-containing protein [Pseudanabaenaceae cyanobacterium bins.68]|nr:PAS domain-containing protein [Pseudanabaenaceae cyanobacterium bins.68]
MLKFPASTQLSQVSQQMAAQGLEVALVVSAEDYPLGIMSLKLLNQMIAAELAAGRDLSSLWARNLDQISSQLEPIQASIAFEPNLTNAREHLLILDRAGKPQELLDTKQLYQKLKLTSQQASDRYNQISKEAARLKFCTEMNHIGCWQLNLLTMTSEWNQILYEILGLAPTIPGHYSTWNDLIHPEDRDRVIAEFNQAIKNHQELEVRHRIVQPSGKEIWLLTRGMALYNDQDQPITMVGICVDITDAHRIRLQLEQKEQEYQALIQQIAQRNQAWQETLDSITEAFVSIDHNWQVIQTNSAVSILTQRDHHQLIGMNFWEVFPQCAENHFGATYRTAMATKEYQEIRAFHPWFNAYLEVRIFPSKLGISLFARDVTESHRLKLERDRLLAYSPWITLIADSQGKLRQLNPAWENILGFTIAESIDRSFMDFVHPDEIERLIAHMRVTRLTNECSSGYELRYITKSGEVKWLSWDCIPFFAEDKIYAFGRDITYRKQIEDAILTLNHSLEQTVIERTQELRRREDYLKAIIKLQNLFIAQPFDQALPQALEILGKVTGSSRVFLFENDFSQGFSTSQIAEWCAPGITSQISNQDLQGMTRDQFPPSWLQTLPRGKYFYAKTSQVPEPHQSRLTAQQICSILEFPIKTQDQWWGFLGFDQCDQVKIWTESEINLLEAVALTLGLAIERQELEDSLLETTDKLNHSITLARSIASSTPSLIYTFDLATHSSTYTNRAPHVELGYDAEQREINPLALMHPEDLGRLKSYLQSLKTAESDQVYQIEYRIRNKDNEWQWYFSQDRVFKRDDQGRVTEIIGSATNISDRKLMEQKLEASLLEKEILLQELNHRVKNNLNLIKSLIVIKGKKITDPIAKQMFDSLQTKIMVISELHQQLCHARQLHPIDLGSYIQSLTSNFGNLYMDSPITIETETEKIQASISTAMSLGLILNELITNAVKYAFPNQATGKILVKLSQDQDAIYLLVRDNGVGFIQLDTLPDFKDSMGLAIVQLLVKQLKGQRNFRAIAEGTEIEIQVPH